MTQEQFISEIKKIGINVETDKIQKLEIYYKMLVEWNKIMNLTRITAKEDVYLKHFYDSLTIVKINDLKNVSTLCDVGTGAGFPGIVLKIFFPHIKIVLIDSLNKRINFLNEVIKKLELDGIEAHHVRMEEYSKTNKNVFDIITSRAVAKIPKLLNISIFSLKENGHLILLKANCDEEILNSSETLKKLNCEINNIVRFELPFEKSNRTLIDIIKSKKRIVKNE